MSEQASELACRLAQDAEAVCRRYLSNGRRQGCYWTVGDVRNTPGRSLFVRLKGARFGKGAAGKWTDAATGDHGDLLDVIRLSCGLTDFHDVIAEAKRFLALPRSELAIAAGHLGSLPPGSDEIRAPTVRHVATDFGHHRGSVFAPTRHHGFARNRKPPLPPALLLGERRCSQGLIATPSAESALECLRCTRVGHGIVRIESIDAELASDRAPNRGGQGT